MKKSKWKFAILVIANLTACRTMAPVQCINQQSQITNQQLRIDSVYHYEKDSMSIFWRSGAMRAGAHVGSDPRAIPAGALRGQTLMCYPARTEAMSYPARTDTMVIERWHTRWRDHEVVKTDTVYQTQTIMQTQTITAKEVPRFYRICTWICCIGVAILVLLLVLKFSWKIH